MMVWGMGTLMMVLFWALVVLLATGLVRLLFPGEPRSQVDDEAPVGGPRAELDRRYARGELTRAAYVQARMGLVTGTSGSRPLDVDQKKTTED